MNVLFASCVLQFEKVYEDLISLEQQIMTFVTHLRGLGLSEESDVSASAAERALKTPSSPVSAVPVYSASQNSASPAMDPDPEPPPKPASRLSAMNCLCGARRRR